MDAEYRKLQIGYEQMRERAEHAERERDALRAELQAAKFHADEFHQGDETMEQIVLSMWDCITKKNVERDRLREALRAVLPACRLDDPWEREVVRAARAALEEER